MNEEQILSVIRSANISVLVAIRKEINKEISFRKKSNNPPKPKLIKNPLRIPSKKLGYEKRAKYIRSILEQKWDYLVDSFDLSEEKKFYVYAHVDPSINEVDLKSELNILGKPFYIGKGTGKRAYDLRRNSTHREKFKELLSSGYEERKIVNIVKDNLTEKEALVLESKLIYIFQTKYESRKGSLYNVDIGVRPDFSPIEENIDRGDNVIRRRKEQRASK